MDGSTLRARALPGALFLASALVAMRRAGRARRRRPGRHGERRRGRLREDVLDPPGGTPEAPGVPPSAYAPRMTDPDALEQLSSQELHDLAVSYAKRHLDVKFFWELMRLLPAAEAAAGDMDAAETDVMRLSAHADDVTEAGQGEVAEMLRPFYIDYLRRHKVTPR